MKQVITHKQLQELDTKQYHILIQWELDKKYIRPNKDNQVKVKRLTIGQMIEFLGNGTSITQVEKGVFLNGWKVAYLRSLVMSFHNYMVEKELCDSLWKAVKDQLSLIDRGRKHEFSTSK